MEAKDAVFRRVGRNLANFQKLEFALRMMIPTLRTSGTISEVKTQLAASRRQIKKLSLGDLAQTFHANLFQEPQELEPPPSLAEPIVTFSFYLQASDEYIKTTKARWRRLTNQRNRLVHSLLLEYDLEQFEECERINSVLDAQNLEVCKLLGELIALDGHRSHAAAAIADHLKSGVVMSTTDGRSDGA